MIDWLEIVKGFREVLGRSRPILRVHILCARHFRRDRMITLPFEGAQM